MQDRLYEKRFLSKEEQFGVSSMVLQKVCTCKQKGISVLCFTSLNCEHLVMKVKENCFMVPLSCIF